MSTSQKPHDTVTAAEIAEMAGVGASAVSNWRKRDPDFPQPVAGSLASPRFSLDEVRGWFQATDRPFRDPSVGRRVWGALEALRGAVPPDEAVAAAGALVTARFVSDKTSPGYLGASPEGDWAGVLRAKPGARMAALWALADAVCHVEPDLGQALKPDPQLHDVVLDHLLAAVDAAPAARLPELFEEVQAFAKRSERGRSETRSSQQLIELLTAVAAPIPGPVFDPVAGTGELLLAVARTPRRAIVKGVEIHHGAWRTAVQRMHLHQVPATIYRGDALESAALKPAKASVVVADPPLGLNWEPNEWGPLPPWHLGVRSRRADLAWLQVAIWHLQPGGRGFVTLPAGAGFRTGSEARLRAELLRQGSVDAVVALAAGSTGTALPLVLWVVARPSEASADAVLMVDASQSGSTPEDIALALHEWRTTGRTSDAVPSVAVSLVDLLTEDANLSPQRWVARDPADSAPGLSALTQALSRVSHELTALKSVEGPMSEGYVPGDRDVRIVTVGDLARAGLTIHRARRSDRTDDTGPGVITALHVRHPHRAPALETVKAKEGDTLFLTKPGDVLVVAEGAIAATVDQGGGHAIAPPIQAIRVNDEWLRPQYLALALTSARNDRFLAGTTIPRAKVQDLEVPLLPPAEQDALIRDAQKLMDCSAAAHRLAATTSDALRTLIASVTVGTVTPRDSNDGKTTGDQA